MKAAVFKSADQAAMLVAALLCVGSAFWAGWGERAVTRVGQRPSPLVGSVADLSGGPAWKVSSSTQTLAPPKQVSEWGFDLFTPPVVFYDRATGRFTVSPAEVETAQAQAAAGVPFGLSLLEVERQSYPLQLVGYAGEPGAYFGIFQNETTGEGLVAQAGETIENLNLQIRSLEVRREDTLVPDSMPLRDMVAVAEVWDPESAQLVRLSSAGWRWTDAPVARVRVSATGMEREVRSGEAIELEGVSFEIRSVIAAPPSIVVGKHHDDGTRETMTLWPEDPASVPFESNRPFAAP